MERMPSLFIGHGSPMNAIEKNKYSESWSKLGKQIPKPQAILSVSAHWFTKGTKIMNSEQPEMIYDMYGFPEELYKLVYPAKGSPRFAEKTGALLGKDAQFDNSWGLDHGTWSVLHHLFPKADIPVFQLSVNALASPEEHFAMGKKLQALRKEGVLIFGSGNVVHNLGRISWDMQGGYDWADEFDSYIKEAVEQGKHDKAIHYEKAGQSASLSFRTVEHYAPLLYVLGASDEQDKLSVWNDSRINGSLSMTSYLFE